MPSRRGCTLRVLLGRSSVALRAKRAVDLRVGQLGDGAGEQRVAIAHRCGGHIDVQRDAIGAQRAIPGGGYGAALQRAAQFGGVAAHGHARVLQADGFTAPAAAAQRAGLAVQAEFLRGLVPRHLHFAQARGQAAAVQLACDPRCGAPLDECSHAHVHLQRARAQGGGPVTGGRAHDGAGGVEQGE